jgi:outer membrane protein insertion porin family/translocation and assembly module TamA
VRGFSQNELGSLIYIAPTIQQVSTVDTLGQPITVLRDSSRATRRVVPVGGNSLVVGNLELRLRSPVLPDLLQFTLFTDAGEVWNRGSTATLSGVKLKVTPGVQVTAFSPVGPVRVAIGYNPYQRPTGPLYYEATNEGGELVCVSPGNTLPGTITPNPTGSGRTIRQDIGVCPSSFQPAKDNRLRSKLTFSFAIGQAF